MCWSSSRFVLYCMFRVFVMMLLVTMFITLSRQFLHMERVYVPNIVHAAVPLFLHSLSMLLSSPVTCHRDNSYCARFGWLF